MDLFPAGMRVLVVDDDPLCLMILERMLRQCSYNVTTCGRAATALSLIRENRETFDLVISDVYMPDMDGFRLLELIGLELDLPVIMMSANGETSQVMKGITHGACDYLLKPVRIEELRNIWQHVVRRKTREVSKEETNWEAEDNGRGGEQGGDPEFANRKRKEKDEDGYDGYDGYEDANALKKARVVWSIQLHQQFVNAVNQLGVEKIVPKRILEIMNVQGLTRENIASHLQKYRLYLKRLSGVQPRPHPVASFQAVQGAEFGGTMQIQSGGGRTAERQLSAKGAMFFGGGAPSLTSSTGGFGAGDGGLSGDVDAATLATFAHVHALSQGTGPPITREVEEMSGGDAELGVPRGPLQSLGLTSLQGLSSADLNMLMQAQQESLDRQRRRIAQAMGGEGRGGYARGMGLNSMQYGGGLGGGEVGMGPSRLMNQPGNEEVGALIGDGLGGVGRMGNSVATQGSGLGEETEGSGNLHLLFHRAGRSSGPIRVEGGRPGMKSEGQIGIQGEENGSQIGSLGGLLQEYRRASRPKFDERTSYV